jgi:hypothetical protein
VAYARWRLRRAGLGGENTDVFTVMRHDDTNIKRIRKIRTKDDVEKVSLINPGLKKQSQNTVIEAFLINRSCWQWFNMNLQVQQ